MAKLTLLFKDKVIRAYALEPDKSLHIGRAESNEIHIDSLAVAPVHAEVTCAKNGASVIRQMDDAFPLTVNNQNATSHQLIHGTRIGIGKHVLEYSDAPAGQSTTMDNPSDRSAEGTAPVDEIERSAAPAEANFQIINGKHIGRLIPIKRALTRLGKSGAGMVVVARRKNGYFLSPLENESSVRINNKTLGQRTVQLSSGDTLEIDHTAMQFFVEQATARAPEREEQPA